MVHPSLVSKPFINSVFLVLGVGILLPWNAYISAKQYFVSRLCNESEDKQQDDNTGETIEMWFSIVYNGASVISLIAVILVQHLLDDNKNNVASSTVTKRKRSVKHMILKITSYLSDSSVSIKTTSLRSLKTKETTKNATWYMVIIPLAVYLLVFVTSVVLVFLKSIPTRIFLIVTLTALFICGACTAIACSGIVGTAGLFPADLGVNPFFNGQAIGGLLVACANFVTSVVDGPEHFQREYCTDKPTSETSASAPFHQDNRSLDEENICIPYQETSLATAGYFLMCCFILAACMVGYNYIDRYKQIVRKNSFGARQKNTQPRDEVDIDGDSDDGNDNDWNSGNSDKPSQLLIEGLIPETLKHVVDQRNVSNPSSVKIVSTKAAPSYQNGYANTKGIRRQDSNDTNTSENTQSVIVLVLVSVRGTALSLFLTYFCTLAIFPVWTSELISTQQCDTPSRIRNDLFVPLSFVVFNSGDLIGRYISSTIRFELISNLSRKLVWASATRVFLFFYLFLWCQARRNRYQDWIFVDNDLFSWSIQLFFAITNGMLTNIAFCYAPTLIENRTNPQQVASAILNLAMTLGLTVGSFFSGPFLKFASGAS